MSRGPHRQERVGTLLKEFLAALIGTELKDPRIGFVTVTGVVVSRDLSVARVHVSVMGTDEEKEESLAGLRSASGFLRSRAAQALGFRTVPELRFVLDRGLENYQRITDLLDETEEPGDGS